MDEPKQRGGHRKGSGAKKKKPEDKKEPTKVIRVPTSKVGNVRELLNQLANV